jgi:hypothetical protein
MKHLIFIAIFCLCFMHSRGQEVLQIPGYTGQATLSIIDNGNKLKVISGNSEQSFPLSKTGKYHRLKVQADTAKLLDLLRIKPQLLDSYFTDNSLSRPIVDRLVNRVVQTRGQMLSIESDDSSGLSTDAESQIEDGGMAGGLEGVREEREENAKSWGVLVGFAILLIILTAVITRTIMRKGRKGIEPAKAEQTSTKSPLAGNTYSNVAELQQQLSTLQQKFDELQKAHQDASANLQQLKTFDREYFNEAFKRYVAPLSNAMDNGATTQVVEYLLKMAAHFSSLTRYKISKKQEHDEANLLYIVKNQMPPQFKEINDLTPLDKMPKNIKVIVDLLKQYQSSGLDESVVAGYKIKNL